jgi:hypothetical protein
MWRRAGLVVYPEYNNEPSGFIDNLFTSCVTISFSRRITVRSYVLIIRKAFCPPLRLKIRKNHPCS